MSRSGVYAYEFSDPLGDAHSTELQYVFGKIPYLDVTPPFTAAQFALSAQMMKYWDRVGDQLRRVPPVRVLGPDRRVIGAKGLSKRFGSGTSRGPQAVPAVVLAGPRAWWMIRLIKPQHSPRGADVKAHRGNSSFGVSRNDGEEYCLMLLKRPLSRVRR